MLRLFLCLLLRKFASQRVPTRLTIAQAVHVKLRQLFRPRRNRLLRDAKNTCQRRSSLGCLDGVLLEDDHGARLEQTQR